MALRFCYAGNKGMGRSGGRRIVEELRRGERGKGKGIVWPFELGCLKGRAGVGLGTGCCRGRVVPGPGLVMGRWACRGRCVWTV